MVQRGLSMRFAFVCWRQPALKAQRCAHHEVQQTQVAPQHALLPVLDQRIEDAGPREQLARILLHPQPRTHFQRQRQKDALLAAWHCLHLLNGLHRLHRLHRLQMQVVPQVAMRQVVPALRLEDIAVVQQALV
jgi:hypothetical protein